MSILLSGLVVTALSGWALFQAFSIWNVRLQGNLLEMLELTQSVAKRDGSPHELFSVMNKAFGRALSIELTPVTTLLVAVLAPAVCIQLPVKFFDMQNKRPSMNWCL